MKLFLDSGNRTEINQKWKGVYRGVTCNPTILKKDGIDARDETVINFARQVAEDIYPLPVSVECPYLSFEKAKEFIHKLLYTTENTYVLNIVVKLPIEDTNGTCLVPLIQELLTHFNTFNATPVLNLNITCLMSFHQALLVSQFGDAIKYVSLFAGRIDDMNSGAEFEIERTRSFLDKSKSSTEIIACSVRRVADIPIWLNAGAHIVTAPPKYFEMLSHHPRTRETIEQFTKDAGV